MRLPASIAFALLLVFGASAAFATTVIALNFDELVHFSDLVVVGEVTTVEAYEQNGRVLTRIEVRVDETLKGTPRDTVQIRRLGGQTDRLVTRVAGMPQFVVGERALLFLESPPKVEFFVVTGAAQGKMSIKTDETGVLRLEPNTIPVHTVARPQTAPQAPTIPMSVDIRTLDAARTRIAEISKAASERSQ